MLRMRSTFALLVVFVTVALRGAEGPRETVLKSESFDKDPGWEGHNNRLLPKVLPSVTQDFGYSQTNFASTDPGELGGKVLRSMTPSYYAAAIEPRTLNDKLSASGTFSLTGAAGSSGVFFGWFDSQQPTGGGRPMGSLGMNIDGEPSGARLAVRMINRGNQACGTFVTPFIPGKFRPTPLRLDGTRYSWTLSYDPNANDGNGQFHYSIKSHGTAPEPLDAQRLPADLPDAHRKEALSHFPNTLEFSVDLPAGLKSGGATFDRFGLLNMTKPGNAMTIYFGDLTIDGKSIAFSNDPNWAGAHNRETIQDPPAAAHDFGFSLATNFAGGQKGEMGGDLWRSGKYAYYADRVGPLTLDDRLEASGKIILKVGAPDSDVYLGWFSSADQETSPIASGNFVGVHIGGPTRVGHYFVPRLTTTKGTVMKVEKGPVLTPEKVFEWSLSYDPTANDRYGELKVTLDHETVALLIRKGQKLGGVRLDRFGLLNSPVGGQLVRIYLDDLKYTTGVR